MNYEGEILPSETPFTGATHWPKQSEAAAFFGKIQLGLDGEPTESWENTFLTTISLPYPMRLSWDKETSVRRIRCHRNISKVLGNILWEIWEYYDKDIDRVKAAGMDLYGGCFNFRRMRGLGSLSMHAYGVAIDLDPDANPLGEKWKPNGKMMPLPVVEIFQRHGATWGGLWNRPDAQHFQFTQPV